MFHNMEWFQFLERGGIMLKNQDYAVAFDAARLQHKSGDWSQAEVGSDLGMSKAAVSRSIGRLRDADVIRGDRVSVLALSTLLPALRYLAPAVVDRSRQVRGLPTSVSAPSFEGRIRHRVPLVWESEERSEVGYAIAPLFSEVPSAVAENPEAYAMLAYLDAAREGRARQYGMAVEGLHRLVGLPRMAMVR